MTTRTVIAISIATLGFMLGTSERTVSAQSTLGTIEGRITDETGAVLPGVTVTVTSVQTGAVVTHVTNAQGIYRAPNLNPSEYTVRVDLAGFGSMLREKVNIGVGEYPITPLDVVKTVLGFETDEEIDDIDRHQDRQGEQEADQQFPSRPGIFQRVTAGRGVRPQMAANVGGKPEPIEAEGDQLQPGAARHQPAEVTAVA